MIVRMKKVTVLCIEADRARTLDALRDLGLLHVEHVRRPEGEDLEEARRRLAYVQRAVEVLPERGRAAPSGDKAERIVEDLWRLIQERKALEEQWESLARERNRIEPFGSFDPQAIAALAERGVTVKLFRAPAGWRPVAPEGVVLHVLRRDRTGTYFAAVARGRLEIEAEEVRLPSRSLAQIEEEIRRTEEALERNRRGMDAHAGDRAVVAGMVTEAADAVRYLEARAGMGTAAPVAYLRGYCPAEAVGRLREAAARHGWGLVVEEPAPGDAVPTLIRNPRWIRPIQAVFDFLGILPGYDEIDVSASFLLFLSLFFAIIVGDAGYGLVFLGLTRWARRRFPAAPAHVFSLLKIMSVCTIVWGALTGTYFGIPNLPAPLARLRIEWLGNERNIQFLSILIGAIHLTLAHGWNLVRHLNSSRALAQVGWICTTWAMFFLAASLVVDVPLEKYMATVPVLGCAFPKFMVPVFFFGVAAITLFMTPPREFKAEWANHVVLPLSIVSNFVDVVSYVRLYAVSLAGLAVASSFNTLIAGSVKGLFSGLLGALALFVAHAVNILLCAMSVLVHGVRLNTLEFSSHIGLQWKGEAYAPFARRGAAPAEGARMAS